MKFAGSVAIVILTALMAVNGAVMLISPRRWFEMPGWLAGHGTLIKLRYSTGWGYFQIRLFGSVLLLIVGKVCYDALVKAR